jgi:protein-tyrosine-phosphatase
MAAAIAKQRWPGCNIQSAGISVRVEGQVATFDAVTAMRRRGIDISDHRTTSTSSVDISSFDCIVALDRAVPDVLRAKGVDLSKVKEAFVDDPIGSDVQKYEACAREIETRLEALEL